MSQLTVIDFIEKNTKSGLRLTKIMEKCRQSLPDISVESIHGFAGLKERLKLSGQLRDRKILFLLSLDEYGWNPYINECIHLIRQEKFAFLRSVGGIIIDGDSEIYTRDLAQDMIFALNQAGCSFPGGPLVEATASLYNFSVSSMNGECSLFEAYENSVRRLMERLITYGSLTDLYQEIHQKNQNHNRKILCVHASKHSSSNTLGLWSLVKQKLDPEIEVREISLENGTIYDCKGCPFQVCIHFGMQNSCYYGGTMVEDVYPALEECDTLILLCPNYNDSVSANIMAFINRLTALYRKRQFYDKQFYAIVVSGYSGSDLVSKQLISALNINKTFILPSRFSWMETANFPGDYQKIDQLEEKAEQFASQINQVSYLRESV